jgi:hypothetical protein
LTGIKRKGAPRAAHGDGMCGAALDQAGWLNDVERRCVRGVTNEHGADIRAVIIGNCRQRAARSAGA